MLDWNAALNRVIVMNGDVDDDGDNGVSLRCFTSDGGNGMWTIISS